MSNSPSAYIIVNGELMLAGENGFPVSSQSLVDAFGIYETILIEQGRFFHLQQHLLRLEQSAQLLNLDLPAPIAEIGDWTRRLAATMSTPCGLLRIVSYGSVQVPSPPSRT